MGFLLGSLPLFSLCGFPRPQHGSSFPSWVYSASMLWASLHNPSSLVHLGSPCHACSGRKFTYPAAHAIVFLAMGVNSHTHRPPSRYLWSIPNVGLLPTVRTGTYHGRLCVDLLFLPSLAVYYALLYISLASVHFCDCSPPLVWFFVVHSWR